MLDTVRARNLSSYDYSRDTTPFLNSFVKESTRFEYAYAPSNWTVSSHGSIFTGTYPWENQTGISSNNLHNDLKTLAGELSQEGYYTIGLSNNVYLSPEFNFDKGFDEFEFNQQGNGEPFSTEVTIHAIREYVDNSKSFPRKLFDVIKYIYDEGGKVTPTAANWLVRKLEQAELWTRKDTGAQWAIDRSKRVLTKDHNEPKFLYINLMEGHTPYYAPSNHLLRYANEKPQKRGWGDLRPYYEESVENIEEDVRGLKNLYDGSIHYLDFQLQRLIQILRDEEIFSNSTIVIAGDHGEAFGEHNLYAHRTGLTNELTRVPLIINTAGGDQPNHIKRPVSLQWIMPTLLKQVGIEKPDSCVEANLFKKENPPVIGQANKNVFNGPPVEGYEHYEEGVRMIVENNMKLIENQSGTDQKLFKINDKKERENLVSEEEEAVQELSSRLNSVVNNNPPVPRQEETSQTSKEVQQQLRRLGYIE